MLLAAHTLGWRSPIPCSLLPSFRPPGAVVCGAFNPRLFSTPSRASRASGRENGDANGEAANGSGEAAAGDDAAHGAKAGRGDDDPDADALAPVFAIGSQDRRATGGDGGVWAPLGGVRGMEQRSEYCIACQLHAVSSLTPHHPHSLASSPPPNTHSVDCGGGPPHLLRLSLLQRPGAGPGMDVLWLWPPRQLHRRCGPGAGGMR